MTSWQINSLEKCSPHFKDVIGQICFTQWPDIARYDFNINSPEEYTSQIDIQNTFVAYSRENEYLGSICLVDDDMPSIPHGYSSPWLACLYVNPEYRKRGIGHSLVEYLVSKVEGPVYLWTKDELVSYYEKLGWIIFKKNIKYFNVIVNILKFPHKK